MLSSCSITANNVLSKFNLGAWLASASSSSTSNIIISNAFSTPIAFSNPCPCGRYWLCSSKKFPHNVAHSLKSS